LPDEDGKVKIALGSLVAGIERPRLAQPDAIEV